MIAVPLISDREELAHWLGIVAAEKPEPVPPYWAAVMNHLAEMRELLDAGLIGPGDLTGDEMEGLRLLASVVARAERMRSCPRCGTRTEARLTCPACGANLSPSRAPRTEENV